MQKGDPMLERAALEALRRWQFNPTGDDKEMVGFITFTFRVQ
jgi:TonB family protein